jgi:hypothetical protein
MCDVKIVLGVALWVLTPCSLEGVPPPKKWKNVTAPTSGFKLCSVTEPLSKMVAFLVSWKSKFQLSTLRGVIITGLYGCSRVLQANVVIVRVTVYPLQ